MSNDPSALLVAFGVIGLLALAMRWIFAPSRPKTRLREVPPDATDSPDLGLLDVVATGLPRADALAARAVLGDANLRSSMSRRRDGTLDVLVFRGDADLARSLLRTAGTSGA